MRKVIVLEKNNAGCTIQYESTNTVHLIPEFMLLRRIKWGIYELSNPEKLDNLLHLGSTTRKI